MRIALMINSASVSEWQFQMLDKIRKNGTGEVVLAIVRGSDHDLVEPAEKEPFALSLFYRYVQWDRKKFLQKPNPFTARPLSDINASISTLTLSPDTTRWVDRLNHADAQTLREHNIDVIIRLGWRILKGDVLTIPRYGVWSFHHGDNTVNRGGPPGVWEHYHRQVCTGVTLQILSEELDDGLVVERSITATDKTSVAKTRHKLYWRSVDMLPRKLEELSKLGFEEFEKRTRAKFPAINFYSQPLLTEKGMTLKEVSRYIWRNASAYVKQAVFERRFEEKWVLYFKLSDEISTSIWQFAKIESDNDRYWADPFIVERDGTYYIFAEEFIYKTRRGRIAVIPVEKDGTVGEARTVLAPDYHLSYPFMFEHDGETFMVPESSENRSIDLYKCTRFPDQWEHVKTLMNDVRAVDTTLYESNGKWWLFTNRCDTEGGTTHDELHVFSANHFLDEEWEPHPQGVVSSDVRMARPAGALFKKGGKLYRPAQDCSVDYGYALQLHEVTELNDERYAEQPISRITPDWNDRVQGVHTFNHVPGMTIVDAKTFIKKSDVRK